MLLVARLRVVTRAGIREARQNLSALIDEVRKGREVVIEERGKPVAKLVPIERRSRKPLSSHRRLRRSIRSRASKSAVEMIAEDRDDRI
ncbi:MAG: type II toxin-antitoxin system prevent-host-death family antitoxin [Deltaproteobacteria bacterium]|nr:type II toxin-antitoxin system prevent-host-death family antitoxin [Deltaproteobacteria bacterium]